MILIDGDTVAYRAAASCEPTKKKPFLEPEREAIFRADAMMINIMLNCRTEDHIAFFSCASGDNFRYRVDPLYKHRRKGVPKPTHYYPVVDYLWNNWKCKMCFGYEADDGIGINYMPGDIVAANDKDMLQIAGQHYNFVKDEHIEVSDYLGQYQLWHQMLEGDYSDSIDGVAGIGKAKAPGYLLGKTPQEMAEVVLNLYDDPARYMKNLKLLRILRSQDEYEAILLELDESEQHACDAEGGPEGPPLSKLLVPSDGR